ncbi:hypothetical protein VHEMI05246 [[Torrubiella] hemipterigena]|uniref:Very-long-chain (3R)-3-hydroxyacyl-CoA dehydratase n=1 Tax=[Torrubiella] hemipterigena TaxID=1531966 RepID=A0A0A1TI80_9HYPO|nr:hypothetical protein VHEMI05246 [[Torrubiella] hemipterigena]
MANASSSSPLRSAYLVVYNALSAAAWSIVLYKTALTWYTSGHQEVFFEVGEWTKWTQTAAALEILHSLLGVVRSPVLTTVMQVSSRFLLVWGIVHPYPFVSAAPTYSSMLIAWSVTEVIRYSFFATAILGMCPGVLLWLRYNTFFILYPVGIFSEVSLIWLTTKIGGLESMIRIALYAILVIYVPGSYILYTYMMKQRARVIKAASGK